MENPNSEASSAPIQAPPAALVQTDSAPPISVEEAPCPVNQPAQNQIEAPPCPSQTEALPADDGVEIDVEELTADTPAVRALDLTLGARVVVTYLTLRTHWRKEYDHHMRLLHVGSRQAKIRAVVPDVFGHKPGHWLPARLVQDALLKLAGFEHDVQIGSCTANFYGQERLMWACKATIKNVAGTNVVESVTVLKGSVGNPNSGGGDGTRRPRSSRLLMALQGFNERLAQCLTDQQPADITAVADGAVESPANDEQPAEAALGDAKNSLVATEDATG